MEVCQVGCCFWKVDTQKSLVLGCNVCFVLSCLSSAVHIFYIAVEPYRSKYQKLGYNPETVDYLGAIEAMDVQVGVCYCRSESCFFTGPIHCKTCYQMLPLFWIEVLRISAKCTSNISYPNSSHLKTWVNQDKLLRLETKTHRNWMIDSPKLWSLCNYQLDFSFPDYSEIWTG